MNKLKYHMSSLEFLSAFLIAGPINYIKSEVYI